MWLLCIKIDSKIAYDKYEGCLRMITQKVLFIFNAPTWPLYAYVFSCKNSNTVSDLKMILSCRREILERDLNRQKEQKSSKVPPTGGFSSYFTSTKENQSTKDQTAYSSKYKGTSFKTRFDFHEPDDFSW